MNEENAKIIERFIKNARPADRVPFILQREIADLLGEIRDELRDMNKKPVGRPAKKTDTK